MEILVEKMLSDFERGALSATGQTLIWALIFFFASAAASSAYLTVSEIFPLELRGQAISYFFAIAQGIGGSAAPSIFGHLIGGQNNPNPDRTPLAWGFGIDTLQSICRLGHAGALVRTAILNLDCCAKARVASISARQQSEEFRAKAVAAMGHKSVQR